MVEKEKRILEKQVKEIISWLESNNLEVNNSNILTWINLYSKEYRDKQ